MNFPRETIEQRRIQLAAQIARQRSELAFCYKNLEKPIHYAEYGLRGFGFIRKNTWVLTAVPAALSVASTLLGMRKLLSGKNAAASILKEEKLARKAAPKAKGAAGFAAKYAGYGWQLFQLYRRVRPYFM